MSTFETTVTGIKRLTNTKNGNPRFEVSTPEGTWKTKPDSSDAGKIGDRGVGKRVRLTLEKGLIQFIDVWTTYPNREEGWY